MSSSFATPREQGTFHAASGAPGRAPAADGVQAADTSVQSTDAQDVSATALRAQVGAVGASFLRVRPWVVAGPSLAAGLALSMTDPSPVRVRLVIGVQVAMMAFFIWEAVGLARAKTDAFVSPRRLGWSLALTMTGLGLAAAFTGAARSPLLPMLLAPAGIAFAAFGARPGGLRFLAYLAGWLGALATFGTVDPWGPVAPMVQPLIGLIATALAAVLLWFGVAALTTAHANAAADLDHLRRVALSEAALRVRDLEAVGAKVAHELKNPLAAVKALTELGRREAVDGRPADRGATADRDAVIANELARMSATLDAYLSYARPLDDLRWRTVSVDRLVHDVAAALEGRAEQAGVRIVVKATRLVAMVDPARLTDALLNLASNAVDATPRGGVVYLAADADERWCFITVQDTGRGMAPATVERLGTPYFTTKDGGTGLGVVLARTVARQHGGDLTYESAPGAGTTARMRLPPRPAGRRGRGAV